MVKINKNIVWVLVASVALLSACSNNQAPVTQGQKPQVSQSGPVPAGYYRVQRGDNLYRIGLKFNQNTRTLASWNNLSDPSQIEVGQLIRVSRNTASASNNTRTTSKSTTANNTPARSNIKMQKPASGPIIANYNGTSNKGIDIGGQRGSSVNAAASGTVMYVGAGVRGYGNLILVKHDNTTLTAYAFNQKILVKEKQVVKAGQQIATMGADDSGKVKLHFEVRVNGKAVNPAPYI